MMWARVVEFMLGCWLAMSPLIVDRATDDPPTWGISLLAANSVMAFALASYWPPLRFCHLGTAIVALLLIGFGRFGMPSPVPPAGQNFILVGLLLLMFAVVPNNASQPPQSWSRNRSSSA